jgi:hypothetical protein
MQIETNDIIQIVDINLDIVNCEVCGVNLVDLANFIYEGKSESTAFDRKEFCRCQHCNTSFILHYEIFDFQGHVYPSVFTEDINNPESNWPDNLTEEQKGSVANHIKDCKICIDRLEHELLTDAWLRDFIASRKGK